MLGHIIALFKARNDSTLAKRIASEMIVDGAIDRLGWPLMIAKFWMSLGILCLCLLIALFFWVGTATHWTLAIPILLFSGAIYGIIRVWLGLNKGVHAVTERAKTELGNRAEALKLPINTKSAPDS